MIKKTTDKKKIKTAHNLENDIFWVHKHLM